MGLRGKCVLGLRGIRRWARRWGGKNGAQVGTLPKNFLWPCGRYFLSSLVNYLNVSCASLNWYLPIIIWRSKKTQETNYISLYANNAFRGMLENHH